MSGSRLSTRISVTVLALCSAAAAAAEPARPASREVVVPTRGVVRALNQAAFGTDLSVRVAEIGFREGQSFKKGDKLLSFDCRRQQAELSAAEAVQKEMQLTVDSNLYLEKHRAVGRHDVDIAKARAEKAAGEAAALRARLEQCVVIAPFDGSVVELAVHVHELPPTNRSFLAIVGNDALEIELLVPSTWLSWMKAGQAFEFTVDETGKKYPTKLVRVVPSIDPVSQLVKVYGEFGERPDDVLSG